MLKDNNRNTRKRCEICSKLIIKTPEWRHWCLSGVFIFNFEHISHFFPVFLLLNLNKWGKLPSLMFFCCICMWETVLFYKLSYLISFVDPLLSAALQPSFHPTLAFDDARWRFVLVENCQVKFPLREAIQLKSILFNIFTKSYSICSVMQRFAKMQLHS